MRRRTDNFGDGGCGAGWTTRFLEWGQQHDILIFVSLVHGTHTFLLKEEKKDQEKLNDCLGGPMDLWTFK